jgi:hypothetical protein
VKVGKILWVSGFGKSKFRNDELRAEMKSDLGYRGYKGDFEGV